MTNLAGVWRRIFALTIDWAASLLVVRLLFPELTFGSDFYGVWTMVIFASEVVLLTWLTGASFGQRIIGLRVVSYRSERLKLWQVLARTLMIILVIPAVVMDKDKRGLHDILVGAGVIKV
jgi:uncharacterized RDD family membrane protein YckC